MEFVTGKAGTNHISGADMAAMYRGLLIADDVVLSEGDKLACTMLDANTAQIGTGSCMLQAHHCRVETAEQVAIESGSPGFKRNDLIVARYSKGDGNIQAIYLAVIKGTAVAGEPSDPTYTSGSIDGGDVLVEFPLWRIPIDGVSVGTPVRVMPTVDTLQKQITDNTSDLQGQITALGESVSQKLAQIGSSDSFGVWLDRCGHVGILRFYVNGGAALTTTWKEVGSLPGGIVPVGFVYDTCYENAMVYISDLGKIGLKAITGTSGVVVGMVPFIIRS